MASARAGIRRRSAIRCSCSPSGRSTHLRRLGRPCRRPDLHGRPVARHRRVLQRPQCQLRHDVAVSVVVPRRAGGRQLPRPRQNKRWDLTANQVYSLSDQTIKLLQTGEPAEVHGLRSARIRTMHRIGSKCSPTHAEISTEMIDPDCSRRAPGSRDHGGPTLVIEYKDRTEQVTTSTNRT